jgi:hypothetical protein
LHEAEEEEYHNFLGDEAMADQAIESMVVDEGAHPRVG